MNYVAVFLMYISDVIMQSQEDIIIGHYDVKPA